MGFRLGWGLDRFCFTTFVKLRRRFGIQIWATVISLRLSIRVDRGKYGCIAPRMMLLSSRNRKIKCSAFVVQRKPSRKSPHWGWVHRLHSLKAEPEQKPTLDPARPLNAKQLLDATHALTEKYRNSEIPGVLKQRTQELMASGDLPKAIYFLRGGPDQSVLTFSNKGTPRHTSVAIFGSPMMADFYGQATKMPFAIHQVRLDEFTPLAEQWRDSGIDSFVFNLSPKGPIHNTMTPNDKLITREQLVFAWASARVIRNFQAQTKLREFLNKEKHPQPAAPESLKAQRLALESLRDFGAFDVPFVHWVIALIAGMQEDEPARLEATAILERFGPSFAGKTARLVNADDGPAWLESWTKATFGLYCEFQMLNGPDGKPLPSILRVEEKAHNSPEG